MGAHITCGIGLRQKMGKRRGKKRTQQEANQDKPIQAEPVDTISAKHKKLLLAEEERLALQAAADHANSISEAAARAASRAIQAAANNPKIIDVNSKDLVDELFEEDLKSLEDEVGRLEKKMKKEVIPMIEYLKRFSEFQRNETLRTMQHQLIGMQNDRAEIERRVEDQTRPDGLANGLNPAVSARVKAIMDAKLKGVTSALASVQNTMTEAVKLVKNQETAPRQTLDGGGWRASLGWRPQEDQFKPPSKKQVALQASAADEACGSSD